LDKSTTYVGLDVHKDTIAIALAEAGGRNDVHEYGKIANTPTALKTLAAKLSRVGSELRFCCEAGPSGSTAIGPRRARLRRRGSVADPAQAAIESRPTGGTRSTWPSCIGRAN
jgi:hypothetical protein